MVIARFLPGWWYCTAIDNALGFGTAADTGVSVAGWAGCLGLVALFGMMFICIGLAAGRFRRSDPPWPPRPPHKWPKHSIVPAGGAETVSAL